MARIPVLVEVERSQPEAFEFHAAMLESPADAVSAAEKLVANLSGLGLEVVGDFPPVPMFGANGDGASNPSLSLFSMAEESPDMAADTVVIQAEVERSAVEGLRKRPGVRVWPNSELTLLSGAGPCPDCGGRHCRGGGGGGGGATIHSAGGDVHPFDLATSGGGVDCSPFKPAVAIEVIRQLLGVDAL